MCLIIASETGKLIDYDVVQRGFDDNPHGWGIMKSDGSRIRASRGMDLKSFEAAYKDLNGEPYVIHFRWATHGTKGLDNCHPFKVNKKLYMAHNGIMSENVVPQPRKDMSDTWHYAQKLRRLGLHSTNLKENLSEIEKDIGSTNKLAFMTADGRIEIANRRAGVEHNGAWLSNDWSLYEIESWGRYAHTWSKTPKRLNVKPAPNSWEQAAASGKGTYDACEGCGHFGWLVQTDFDDFPWSNTDTPLLCDECVRQAQACRDYATLFDAENDAVEPPLHHFENDPRREQFDRLLCEMSKH